MTNEDTTDFDEHFAKISSYIVDTLHGVPLEMNEYEKEQFRIQVISNQYAERLRSDAEKTETYRGLSKIDILHQESQTNGCRKVIAPNFIKKVVIPMQKKQNTYFENCYHQTVKEYKSNGSLIRSKTDYYQAIGG